MNYSQLYDDYCIKANTDKIFIIDFENRILVIGNNFFEKVKGKNLSLRKKLFLKRFIKVVNESNIFINYNDYALTVSNISEKTVLFYRTLHQVFTFWYNDDTKEIGS